MEGTKAQNGAEPVAGGFCCRVYPGLRQECRRPRPQDGSAPLSTRPPPPVLPGPPTRRPRGGWTPCPFHVERAGRCPRHPPGERAERGGEQPGVVLDQRGRVREGRDRGEVARRGPELVAV